MMELTAAALVDAGICPTCYDREHDHALYGDCSDKLLFENELFECMLVGNPRAPGHTAIISKAHYKDMLEIPDQLCQEVYLFAKKVMQALKAVYGSESVYLCTMCDGPHNTFYLVSLSSKASALPIELWAHKSSRLGTTPQRQR